MKKAVIIGGGFSGINLALDLSKYEKIDVTLVDKNNYNFFHPLLYQVATGLLNISSISTPFRSLLRDKRNLHFRLGEFQEVLPQKRKVVLSNGELYYDYLVLALGTTTNFFGNESIKENAYPMKNLAQAIQLRNSLLSLAEEASIKKNEHDFDKLKNIVITGGGPSGVEVAGMLAELKTNSLPKIFPELKNELLNIYLVEGSDSVLRGMSQESQQYAIKSLRELGVNLKLNTLVKDYKDDQVLLSDGSNIKSKILIWTAGVKNPVIKGLDENIYHKTKRIGVNEYNMIKGYEDIFAIGDICMQTHQENYENGYPQMASVATQQGKALADNMIKIVNGRNPEPFHYTDKGTMAIIGKSKATADLVFPKRTLTGWLAWAAWLFIHLFLLINYRNRVKTMWEWTTSYFFKTHVEGLLVNAEKSE